MDDDMLAEALRGLRSKALRAQRKREPALMIEIGLADAEPQGPELDEEEDEDDDAVM